MDLKEALEHHIIDQIYGWITLFGFKLPISKHLFMIFINIFILVVIFPIIIRSRSRYLFPLRSIIEIIVIFIRDEIVKPNLGELSKKYLSYFVSLFFFILGMNLLGFVPFGATASGNISVTIGLALTSFFLIIFSAIKEKGFVHFVKFFIPSGIPFWLYPIIVPIEIVGLFTKTAALAIRLFANMISGHMVILVLIFFIFIFGAMNVYLGLFLTAPFSILLVLFISLLEVFVAFLQAYIFTFLTSIFVSQTLSEH